MISLASTLSGSHSSLSLTIVDDDTAEVRNGSPRGGYPWARMARNLALIAAMVFLSWALGV